MNEAAPARTAEEASGATPDPEQQLWSRFARAVSADALLRSWLALTCHRLDGVSAGLLLLGAPDAGPYTLAAGWPDTQADFSALTGVAEQCLRERRPVVERGTSGPGAGAPMSLVAFPLLGGGVLWGAVVVRGSAHLEPAVQALVRELHWSSAWVDAHLLRGASRRDAAGRQRISQVLDLAAIAIDGDDARSASTALVNELATRLGCDRVSLGFRDGARTHLAAMSHNASFGKQMNLVRALEAAMDEALDQASAVVLPSDDNDTRIVRAHLDLQQQHGSTELLTVPVRAGGELVGALTLERAARQPFTGEEVELMEGLAAFAGPVLELKRRDDRWLGAKVWVATRRQLTRLLGPRHIGRKLVVAALASLALYLGLATGTHTVTADASVQGAIQRAVVAPRDGFVADVRVRPGDAVDEGALLFTLDDRDLRVERLQVQSRREQLASEHREVKAGREWAKANILAAQIRQAEAQLALLDAEIARSALRAPFAGLVVAGDLSQSLGAPVTRGEVLLQLAPLDRYRIVLAVDERDIDAVQPDQQGALLLAALADADFRFRIERITPVASARDGGNFFRVEARLDGSGPGLRPGMEGVGKVHVGERSLAWIWTHRLRQQLELWSWKWLP